MACCPAERAWICYQAPAASARWPRVHLSGGSSGRISHVALQSEIEPPACSDVGPQVTASAERVGAVSGRPLRKDPHPYMDLLRRSRRDNSSRTLGRQCPWVLGQRYVDMLLHGLRIAGMLPSTVVAARASRLLGGEMDTSTAEASRAGNLTEAIGSGTVVSRPAC